jgi:hypothetical protein
VAFERMANTDNRDRLGKVLMRGSVSYFPSTRCSIRCFWRRWPDEYKMRR